MLTGSVFLLVFLHGLIQENFNIYCESIGIKCFDYWYFSLLLPLFAVKEKMKYIFQDIANRT
jgi:hypothetical protein